VIEQADQWSSRSAEQLAQLLEKQQGQFDRVQDVQHLLDTTLAQFKKTLTEYTAVVTDLSQIAAQTGTMATTVMGATHAIKQAGEATERTAQLAGSQVERFTVIVDSMQRYGEIFSQVEAASGKLLGQIEQHLRHYTEVTHQGFDTLTRAANEEIANAYGRLGATVDELDERLEDLTGILERFNGRGERNGRP
jgi:methyl-accepting chemotaxis protein